MDPDAHMLKASGIISSQTRERKEGMNHNQLRAVRINVA